WHESVDSQSALPRSFLMLGNCFWWEGFVAAFGPERKTGDAAVYHAEFVAQALSPNDFRVVSFDAAFLDALDTLNPAYRLGLAGSAPLTQAVIDQAKADGVDFLAWKNNVIDQSVVDLVYANGLELMVWTVNDAGRMQEMINLGVGSIYTDNPVLLRSLLP
ncbi:glycerophosphodiester phosphodiesterase, partial [Akkermansiaceae bacterium]|nr:glycerophosphodiester phosphodiesterase [Akkermansiaceae bacterium]